jgi:Amt family ammonium transporter
MDRRRVVVNPVSRRAPCARLERTRSREGRMEELQANLDIAWMLLCGAMVFMMQAGFTAVEAGFSRAKNSISVGIKNLADMLIACVVFMAFGFSLIFGDDIGGIIGWSTFGLTDIAYDDGSKWAFVAFQMLFAGTAATIVSGALAERTKFSSYLFGTLAISALIYPVYAHWAWGGGFLAKLQFVDFAGSTVVHSVGGWVALAAVIVVGPRIGKFNADGTSNQFSASNIVLATIGVMILWFGWFAFNAGSTVALVPSVALIFLNTGLGAAAGGLSSMFYSRRLCEHVDPGHILNGTLAGLVSVTAGCAVLTPITALLVGAVGGIIAVWAMGFVEHRLRVDDVVGAAAVHGFGGVWGTIAVVLGVGSQLPRGGGLDDRITQLGVQLLGVGVAFSWAFGVGYVAYRAIDAAFGVRVSEEDELRGLNVAEHGARISLLDSLSKIRDLAERGGDLSDRLHVEPGDDAEELNEALNMLLDTLDGLIQDVKGQAVHVSTSSEQMLGLVGRLRESSSDQDVRLQSTFQFFDELERRIREDGARDEDVVRSIDHAVRSLRMVDSRIEAGAQREQEVNDTILQAFAAFEELAQRIRGMESDLDRVTGVVEEATTAGAAADRSLRELFGTVDEIADAAARSLGETGTVTEIADRIDLLALNANIEAARAGEHGRGFRVVADEVKKLANGSKEAVERIEQVISVAAKLAESGRGKTGEAATAFEGVEQQLGEVPAQVDAMRDRLRAVQDDATGLVARLDGLRAAADELERERMRQRNELRELVDRLGELQSGTDEFTAARQAQHARARTMAGQLESVRSSVGDVHVLAGDFDAEAGNMQVRSRMLQRQVSRFRTSDELGGSVPEADGDHRVEREEL